MVGLPLAPLLRRDKAILLSSLAGVVALAWVYLARMAADMSAMALSMPEMRAEWTPAYFSMMFLMWVIMMLGMMLPSVAPVILLYARVVSGGTQPSRPVLRGYVFAGGYLLAWVLFSLAATLLQWGLDELALLSADMRTLSPWLGAGILAAAGVYQWTPAKRACLEHCRGPVDYLGTHWRPGVAGALRMGLGHGWYCLGCCWALMALLFVGGVMNLLVIGLITLFVLLEKLAGFGETAGRWSGAALLGCAALWVMTAL